MKLKIFTTLLVAAAMAFPLVASAGAYELNVPSLTYRTGPYAPNGIPFANGYADYWNLLNERDGGIEGIKVNLFECETAYNTQQGVECYENTKGQNGGSLIYQPLSTGITYQLIPKVTEDNIPLFSMGYGRTSAANGKVFPWIFNFPATYWDGATAIMQYVADREGGMDKLKGKKIALVYHNSAYGKEPIRTLEVMAAKYGFELQLLPVDHPGQEQKATWLQVRKDRPDWVLLWGWGVMNQVAIKEAASVRYPMDHFVGIWWSASENDVLPAGDEANGYLAATVHAAGAGFPVHQDIFKFLYDKGKGAGERERVGEVLYNRGVLAAVWTAEAMRNAMNIHKTKEITPAMLRDGFETLKVDEKRLADLGLKGFTYGIEITCANHSGPGKAAIQQWDAKAKQWKIISKFYDRMDEITGPLIEEDSAGFAKESNITPRSCG